MPDKKFMFQRNLYLKFPIVYSILLRIRMLLLWFIKKKHSFNTEIIHFMPYNGAVIKITWLPNPRNTPGMTSSYIGMEGVAEDIKPDGSFVLKGKTNILIVGKEYTFEYLNANDYFNS